MEEHLKNVRQEVGHTNALMAAKKKEIATEEHLCALAAREAGRCVADRDLCTLCEHNICLGFHFTFRRCGKRRDKRRCYPAARLQSAIGGNQSRRFRPCMPYKSKGGLRYILLV